MAACISRVVRDVHICMRTARSVPGDVPPTGRKVDGPYVNIFDFEGDRVVRNRLTFDRLDLLEKLGLAPVPAMAASR
jgi:predicted ester cyclase